MISNSCYFVGCCSVSVYFLCLGFAGVGLAIAWAFMRVVNFEKLEFSFQYLL